jgi:tRNA A22 N-methylase
MNKFWIRSIANTQNEVLSTVILLKDNKRYYNIINVTNEEAEKRSTIIYCTIPCLKELVNQEMLFDFEGSDLQGVQKFYEKFGAINQPYFHWHYNLLPKPIKWLKK